MGLSERNIIAEIASMQSTSAEELVQGIGDDCAVVRKSAGMVHLWTTDTLVEGVHFDLSWHPPLLLGRKAVSVNVSDIAAMGGRPRFALLSLGLTSACRKEWLDSFMEGFLSVLDEHDMVLVGGDTVHSGERIMLSVTVCGEMAEEEVCYRSQAEPGDTVWVSGVLGEAACGLELCRRGLRCRENDSLCRAHLDPFPRVALARLLAACGHVHAMMDLSDGLATDLAHICRASSVGAEIRADELPLSAGMKEVAGELLLSPVKLALEGGEDYQLVFTAPPDRGEKLQQLCRDNGMKITAVGSIVVGEGVVLREAGARRDISFGGYEHRF